MPMCRDSAGPVKLDEIQQHGYVLTPGRYVGAEDVEDDDEAFSDKMERLTAQLAEQIARRCRSWMR
jgi:type I restriction enzyme M protein